MNDVEKQIRRSIEVKQAFLASGGAEILEKMAAAAPC